MSALAWPTIILVWLMVTAALAVIIQGCHRTWSEEEAQLMERQAHLMAASQEDNDPLAIYIAGPMTGLPDFNYPAFHAAEMRLQAAGYRTLNPARNPKQSSWENYMRVGLRQLLNADAIALLPGWESSTGANIEKQLAFDLGLGAGTVENWITISEKIGPHRVESPYRAREQR